MDEKKEEQTARGAKSETKGSWPTSAKAVTGLLALIAAGAVGYGIAQSGSTNDPAPTDPAITAAEAGPEETGSGDTEGASPSEGTQEFGTPIELRGSGTTVAVNPEEYLGKVTPDPYGYVGRQQELLGFILSFENTGDKKYEGFPGSDVILIDSESGQWTSDDESAAPGSDCAPILFEIRILPGAERRGCLTFTVPKGTEPKELQASLDAAYGPDTGVWSVPGT